MITDKLIQNNDDEDKMPTYLDLLNNSKFKTDIIKYEYHGNKNEYYKHTTYKVSSLCEFIEVIKALAKINEEDTILSTLIYRGMSKTKAKHCTRR